MGRRLAFGVLSLLSAAAVLWQLWLFLLGSGWTLLGIAQAVGLFLFFFTHLTNAAIAVAAGRLAWRFDGLLARPAVATALAVYAVVVCAVYELALRHLWHPRGLQLVIDTVFHDVVPAGYVFAWAAFIPNGRLRWRHAAAWLVPPVIYAGVLITVGLIAGASPYPFLDVRTLGGLRVAANVVLLTGVFGGVGMAFVWLDRRLAKN